MNPQTLPKIEGPNVGRSAEPEFIDVDMPFEAEEIEKATCKRYVEQLTRSDMPIVAAQPIPAEGHCSLGQRSCEKFLKKGGCRQAECPIIAAEKKKGRAAVATEHVFDPIDVDMPFSAAEVAAFTSEAYVAALGPSDMPIVGRWGQFAPSAGKVPVVDDDMMAANRIRTPSRRGFSAEEPFTCEGALA
jgi:hypothetical protein